MRISIVIPTYNGSEFVKSAIESAVSQTRPADEIIVSDDNSTDETLCICRQFGDKISLFINHSGPSGFVNGWNWAIQHATGDYIAILHQDDTLSPRFLEEAEKALASNSDVKHLFVPCEYIDANGMVIQHAPVMTGEVKRYTGLQYVKAYQQIGHPHIHRCPGVITHRSIFEKCKYRTEAGHIADDDFFYRVGQYTDVVGVLKPLAQYRLHEKSETGHLEDIKLIQRLIHDYTFQIDEMEKNTIFDNECKSYFRKWLAKVIEMELIHILRHGDASLLNDYKNHLKLLEEKQITFSRKMKLFNTVLNIFGLRVSNRIITYIYKFKKQQ